MCHAHSRKQKFHFKIFWSLDIACISMKYSYLRFYTNEEKGKKIKRNFFEQNLKDWGVGMQSMQSTTKLQRIHSTDVKLFLYIQKLSKKF